ncbi:HAD family hydrolase [Butyrivibrio fibrisolvens]|uniref:HAD family hydrolase n=1 Tax=Butyrivibrio fibrisolvens TaxID=831 RepID=UPI00042074F7|nr:HAD family hydrolase [Butyrivibrio fibrisolvens]
MITINSILEVQDYIDDYEGIIFDLDDTLYGEKQYVRSGYKEVASVIPQVDRAYDKLYEAFLRHENAIDVVLASAGIDSEEVKALCLKKYRYQKPDINLYEGVDDLLAAIREARKKIGIITDGRPEGQRAKIKALGLEKMVDHIIITDELGGIDFRKPCPVAFKKMHEIMGVPYEKLVYIGDNMHKDFIAPRELGMGAIHFKNVDGLYYSK